MVCGSNLNSDSMNANNISYSNGESGLTASDVQGAIDELAQSYPAEQVMMSDGVTSVEDAITPEYEVYTLGDYFFGYIIRLGSLRILSLYNGNNSQPAAFKQLAAKDVPAQTTKVGSWVAIDENGTSASRYLEANANGTLSSSDTVYRGGFTLIYNV